MAEELEWKVYTHGLLREILDCNPSASVLRVPISILGKLLAEVGERAAELNDPQLNALMCRLAIYTIADPHSPDYDAGKVQEILSLAKLDAIA